jgi:hypothetical protein
VLTSSLLAVAAVVEVDMLAVAAVVELLLAHCR